MLDGRTDIRRFRAYHDTLAGAIFPGHFHSDPRTESPEQVEWRRAHNRMECQVAFEQVLMPLLLEIEHLEKSRGMDPNYRMFNTPANPDADKERRMRPRTSRTRLVQVEVSIHGDRTYRSEHTINDELFHLLGTRQVMSETLDTAMHMALNALAPDRQTHKDAQAAIDRMGASK